ncbi:MAG: sodium-dependent bicarbonate transport family permease [Bacteriovoracaceae bacterium]|nr:sodium-dependent bicarbonate transport family permease [Bacteriovoracaceae bacterium]
MNTQLLLINLTNPTLLFFVLGIVATIVKSDLEIPSQTIKFISIYLLFSIGFKGGQELVHAPLSEEIIYSFFFGILIALIIPFYSFFILKKRVGVFNAGAVAAAYGSVSAVTFVSAANYLQSSQINFGGHMVAIMALMEAPAIIVGVVLMRKYSPQNNSTQIGIGSLIQHSFTNGSVLMVLGSLIIGTVANSKHAEGIKPFTTDIFQGFLSIFLLEMGMVTAKRIKGCLKYGKVIFLFALLVPLINGCLVAFITQFLTSDPGNRFMFSILAASASYIAVPASMRLAAPEADPGLYIPMALGLTFPFNITFGMPIYMAVINHF